MSTVDRLRALAGGMRNLLGCSRVCCMLHCPDEALCHPLFHLLPPDAAHPIFSCEPAEARSLFAYEQVRTLCDMVMRSGRTWYLNHISIAVELGVRQKVVMGSIAVAPLERPAGLLGCIICLDSDPEAFLAGECLLIERSLPTLARYVERLLCDACAPLTTNHSTEASPETMHTLDALLEGVEEGQAHMAFLSLVCHELRAPLAAIKGYAGLLQTYGVSGIYEHGQNGEEEGIEPAVQQHYLDVIMEQTRQLELLIGDLLDLSRMQLGRLVLRPTTFDLAQLCQQMVHLMQQRADHQEAGRYHIRCILDETLPQVHADPMRTQQVLINLLENAVKYSPDGGPIELEVRAGQQQMVGIGTQIISVTVRDQGIGIPYQQQSRLFKPFQRLERPTMLHMPGSGLGLYISRRLIEAMGGRIHLTSREHEGTSITFTLPIASPHHDDAARQLHVR